MKKLLFSLEEITSYSMRELRKEQYFVTFIYDPNAGISDLNLDKENLYENITGEHSKFKKCTNFRGYTKK